MAHILNVYFDLGSIVLQNKYCTVEWSYVRRNESLSPNEVRLSTAGVIGTMKFIRLFEPITINRMVISNRIVMPAMALFYTNSHSFTDRYKAFYAERARGGLGLMIIGPMAIDTRGSTPFIPGLFNDSHIEPIREFVDSIHNETNIKIGIQLMQQGYYASCKKTGITPIAASPVKSRLTGETPREMTRKDIEEVGDAFARAAIRAKKAGVDYVELMAGGGYLIGGFLSAVTNRRADEYGGPLKNRMRFGLEVIEKVRKALGEDFPMGIRVSGHDYMPGGNTIVDSVTFCVEAEKAGANCINVTGGWHETSVPQITTDVPAGTYVYLARAVKEMVGIPVFASNRLGDPALAEKVLRSGAADMVCWGRPLIADPELPNKVRMGRLDEIVPCIGCNQGCLDSIFSDSPVCCTLNPRVGREAATEVKPAANRKRVYVAGGGPAGMEFALIAAQRGHDVTLCEKDDHLGGQINLIGSVPHKGEFLAAVKSLEARMKVSGVKVRLNTLLTTEMLRVENPDLAVAATGARPARINLPGIDKPHVVDAWDVLAGNIAHFGKRVVIVGGGATGCETALFVAALGIPCDDSFSFLVYHKADDIDRLRYLLYDSGRKITVIEIADKLAASMGNSARWALLKNLKLMGIELRLKTKITSIEETGIVVETTTGKESIEADTVIIATGSKSENNFTQQHGMEIIKIGDAKEPRNILSAVREGLDAALEI
jgi:2,4-dienoyl-CoA reductase (NADPH2)